MLHYLTSNSGKAFAFLALVSLSACVRTGSDGPSQATYDQLRDDYNSLVVRFNVQTKRNTEGDADLGAATLALRDLDEAVAAFHGSARFLSSELLRLPLIDRASTARRALCVSLRDHHNGRLRAHLDNTVDRANALAQRVLPAAINRIANDPSSYRADVREEFQARTRRLREQISPGLSGIKSLALAEYDRLRGALDSACTELGTERAAPAFTPPPAPPRDLAPAAPLAPVPQGSIITGGGAGGAGGGVVTREEFVRRYRGSFSESALSDFERLAQGTGGFVGYSPSASDFSATVDAVLERVLSRTGRETDVAIVLDTTSSMQDDIDDVKRNMSRILTRLGERAISIGLQLGLVLYRDRNRSDEYLTRVELPFTSDHRAVNDAIQRVTVAGGGDEPEAVLDALETAHTQLAWRRGSVKSVLLIGDAPGHPRSHGSSRTFAQVADLYKAAGTEIVIYPILVNR